MSEMQLLSKVTIGGQELKNRVVLAPLTRARCDPTDDPFDVQNTIPNDLMAEYYSQRASGGLLITEATAISEAGSGWLNAPQIRNHQQVKGWKNVVDRVHEKNGVIYLQLWHMGRQSHSSFHPSTNDIVAPSSIAMEGTTKDIKGENVEPEVPREMTVEDIKQTIQDYVHAARLAKEAGFDGLEVHGANGYLIDEFLQSSSNQRTDQYGGCKENRVRFLVEVIEALIADGAFPANRIGFRVSPNGSFGGMGSKDNDEMFAFVAKTMSKYDLAYLHAMDGVGFGYHNKCKVVTVYDLKKNFEGPIIANVGLTKDVAEGMIRSGAADLCCFGRTYMSNPDLVERFQNNWPLNPDAEYETWWRPTGAEGYTDFPTYSETVETEK